MLDQLDLSHVSFRPFFYFATPLSAFDAQFPHTIGFTTLPPPYISQTLQLSRLLHYCWFLICHSSCIAMDQPLDRLQESVKALERYAACDISDALLQLKVPGAGFVADLAVYHDHALGQPDATTAPKTIAPASTVLFAENGATLTTPAKNIPGDAHWADLTEPDSIVVMKQPDGQTNAVCGGITALRMKVRRVKGIVTIGRIRDVDELRSTGLLVSFSACLNLTRRREGLCL